MPLLIPDLNINEIYRPGLDNQQRCLLLYGGAGSGKSYFAAQKILSRMMNEPGHRILLVRKVARSIRDSQYQLLKNIICQSGWEEDFKFVDTRMEITYKPNDNKIISTGLRDTERLKSLVEPTIIWIEEATQLTKRDFIQVNLRMRGKLPHYKQILITFNPVNKNHWLYKDYVENENKNAMVIVTTWRDNGFLDEDYHLVFEEFKDTDPEYYKIYAMGQWGDGGEGLIYKYELVNKMPETATVVYGVDFGFNDPNVLIKVGIDKRNLYAEEIIYKHKSTNTDFIPQLKRYLPDKRVEIYADASEPNRIQEIFREGFNIHPAIKDVNDGIDKVKSFKLHVVRGSANLIRELDGYQWKQDKNGGYIDAPDKHEDHACDALRYAVFTHLNRKRMKVLAIV